MVLANLVPLHLGANRQRKLGHWVCRFDGGYLEVHGILGYRVSFIMTNLDPAARYNYFIFLLVSEGLTWQNLTKI